MEPRVRFWRNEIPKLNEGKTFMIEEVIPYLEKNGFVGVDKGKYMKNYNTYLLNIDKSKAVVLDSGDYKRVYLFVNRNVDSRCYSTKMNDYNARYLMFMFYIEDNNYEGDNLLINETVERAIKYIIGTLKDDYISEMLWNTSVFKRPERLKITKTYNETEIGAISMDYLSMMLHMSVLTNYIS